MGELCVNYISRKLLKANRAIAKMPKTKMKPYKYSINPKEPGKYKERNKKRVGTNKTNTIVK